MISEPIFRSLVKLPTPRSGIRVAIACLPHKIQLIAGKLAVCIHSQVTMDRNTGKSRGFGFISMADTEAIERILSTAQHTIGEKQVEASFSCRRGLFPDFATLYLIR